MSEHFTCVDCSRGFTLSYDEQRWYRDRGWEIPKRCDDCRSRRRHEDVDNAGLSNLCSLPVWLGW